MGFKVVRKVPSHYVSDDCLQQMLGYRDGVMIINSKGMIYEDTETDKYNSYLTDERRFNFPYHNIPTHIQRFGMRKYKFVNLILDYGKIYLHFTPQGMFTQQAFKNGEEGLVVYERIMNRCEPKEKLVTREELDKYFEYKDNSYYICNGKPVGKITIPTNEQILNFYKTELRIALTNNTTDRTISLEKIDEIIDGIINEPKEGAHKDPSFVANNIKDVIKQDLKALIDIPKEDLIEARYSKFRKMGDFC